jgi:single-strand DNA-binding protein
MSYYYNHVTLVGRVANEPELTRLSENLVKLNFIIAVSRGFKKESGSKEADFIPVVLWGKVAMSGNQLLKKGVPALVWGKVKIGSYMHQEQRKWSAEVVAENFQILQSKSATEAIAAMKAN